MTMTTNSTLSIPINGLADLPKAAQALISFAADQKIWIFDGEMGAGKTTLITAICQQLQVVDTVSSPTFSIVNEYATFDGQTLYHFDFYRLKDELEALDIGLEEYLDSGNICMMEWASKVVNLLPEQFLHIRVEIVDEQSRMLHLTNMI